MMAPLVALLLVVVEPSMAEASLPPPPPPPPPLPSISTSTEVARVSADDGPDAAVERGPDRRLLDLEADILREGEWQFNLFGLVYTRGILPRFSLSTSILGDVATALNLTARVQVVDEPFLRLTAEVGGAYLLAARLLKASFYWVPAEVRATVPLLPGLEVSVAMRYRLLGLQAEGTSLAAHTLAWTSSLVYHDPVGATFLEVTVPAVNIARQTGALEGIPLDGVIALDNVAAWGVMLGRDQRFGRTGHFRIGVGYRNQPGILLLESYGKLLVSLDLYWR